MDKFFFSASVPKPQSPLPKSPRQGPFMHLGEHVHKPLFRRLSNNSASNSPNSFMRKGELEDNFQQSSPRFYELEAKNSGGGGFASKADLTTMSPGCFGGVKEPVNFKVNI